MNSKSFEGIGVALVTPFDENCNVDYVSLEMLVDFVIDGGVDFLVALGTTAETATLTSEEKEEIVKTIVRVNNGRLPIMLGLGGNDTQKLINELKSLSYIELCQSILSVTPYYNKPNQRGLYEHYVAVCKASPLPICLYNVPSRTGINLEADTITSLLKECDNIIALKEAAGSLAQATDLVVATQGVDNFVLLSGDDAMTLPFMAIGFEGLVSVGANAYPGLFSTLMASFKSGDIATARECHLKISSLCKLLFEEGNPAGVKAALHSSGVINHNTLRLPLVPASEDLYKRISTQ